VGSSFLPDPAVITIW